MLGGSGGEAGWVRVEDSSYKLYHPREGTMCCHWLTNCDTYMPSLSIESAISLYLSPYGCLGKKQSPSKIFAAGHAPDIFHF